MRRTKEEAAITREHLLKAALDSFRAKGYAATTLDDIALAAGTTRGAIHWHFGSRAELFNTLVREQYQRAAVLFQDMYATTGTPLQQFRQLLTRWLSYAEENEDFRTMLELVTLKTEVSPELAGGMQEKVQGQRRTLASFASFIQKGMDSGEVHSDIDPYTTAIAALGMLNGITSLWLIDPAAFSLKAIAPKTIDIFLSGIINDHQLSM